jgi:hypothetical protein
MHCWVVKKAPGKMQVSYRFDGQRQADKKYARVYQRDTIQQLKEKISQASPKGVNSFYLSLQPSNTRLGEYDTVTSSGITHNADIICGLSFYRGPLLHDITSCSVFQAKMHELRFPSSRE